MKILLPFITLIFGSILGAWINNVFTWRIKEKIEIIDRLRNSIYGLLKIAATNSKSIDELDNLLLEIIKDLDLLGEPTLDYNKLTRKFKDKYELFDKLETLLDELKIQRNKIQSFRYMLSELNPLKK